MLDALPPLKCDGCRKCCQGDTITLAPGDDPRRFKTRLVDGQRQLRKRKDGSCIYLGSRGCTIYGRQPVMCATFDYRVIARLFEGLTAHQQADRLALPHYAAPLEEGRRRLGLIQGRV